MTKADTPQLATACEAIPLQLQRDKDGQFFDLPKDWNFTNGQVWIHQVEGGLLLKPIALCKLKLPQDVKQALDYPKHAIKRPL